MNEFISMFFPFIFVGMWIFISMLLSFISGWHSLQKIHKRNNSFNGKNGILNQLESGWSVIILVLLLVLTEVIYF